MVTLFEVGTPPKSARGKVAFFVTDFPIEYSLSFLFYTETITKSLSV